jgi:hypothetical protein
MASMPGIDAIDLTITASLHYEPSGVRRAGRCRKAVECAARFGVPSRRSFGNAWPQANFRLNSLGRATAKVVARGHVMINGKWRNAEHGATMATVWVNLA